MEAELKRVKQEFEEKQRKKKEKEKEKGKEQETKNKGDDEDNDKAKEKGGHTDDKADKVGIDQPREAYTTKQKSEKLR